MSARIQLDLSVISRVDYIVLGKISTFIEIPADFHLWVTGKMKFRNAQKAFDYICGIEKYTFVGIIFALVYTVLCS